MCVCVCVCVCVLLSIVYVIKAITIEANMLKGFSMAYSFFNGAIFVENYSHCDLTI